MVDVQGFECLLEDLNNEIENLGESVPQGNLKDIHDALYGIFEEINAACDHYEKVDEENTILKKLLADHLSDEDKRYFQVKYDIDF